MNILLLCLVGIALVAIGLLKGGVEPAFLLPCYGVLALAALLSWLPARRLTIPSRTIPCVTASAVFFGYILLRAVVSRDDYLARDDLFMVTAALIIYLLVALHLTSPAARATLIIVMLFLAMGHTVVGIIQFNEGQNFMPFKSLPRADYGSRASGFFGCPNHLAGFLEVALLLGLGMTCWSRWRIWAKILMGYGSLVCLVGIFLSASRGGYISTFVGLLIFALLSLLIVSRQIFDRLGYLILTVGGVALLLGFGVRHFVNESATLRPRMESITTLDGARLQIWPSAIQQFRLNPVFGTGSGTFLYYGRQFRDRRIQLDPVYTHNDYLQLLAEYGVIGLAGLFVFLFVHGRSAWAAFNGLISLRTEIEGVGNNTLALTIGTMSSAAAIAVHSLVDFNLHIPVNTLLLACVFGILANPGSALPPERIEPTEPVPRPVRFALPILGASILIFALPKFPAEYYAAQTDAILADWRSIEEDEFAARAEVLARRGLRFDRKNTQLWKDLGDTLVARAELARNPAERTRLYTESTDAFRRAMELAPQDRDLVLALGRSLDALQRYDEADPLFVRALELDPNSGYVRWAFAAHLHLRGRLAEAEVEYQKSYETGGGIPAQDGLRRVTEELKGAALAIPPPQ